MYVAGMAIVYIGLEHSVQYVATYDIRVSSADGLPKHFYIVMFVHRFR